MLGISIQIGLSTNMSCKTYLYHHDKYGLFQDLKGNKGTTDFEQQTGTVLVQRQNNCT